MIGRFCTMTWLAYSDVSSFPLSLYEQVCGDVGPRCSSKSTAISSHFGRIGLVYITLPVRCSALLKPTIWPVTGHAELEMKAPEVLTVSNWREQELVKIFGPVGSCYS